MDGLNGLGLCGCGVAGEKLLNVEKRKKGSRTAWGLGALIWTGLEHAPPVRIWVRTFNDRDGMRQAARQTARQSGKRPGTLSASGTIEIEAIRLALIWSY